MIAHVKWSSETAEPSPYMIGRFKFGRPRAKDGCVARQYCSVRTFEIKLNHRMDITSSSFNHLLRILSFNHISSFGGYIGT